MTEARPRTAIWLFPDRPVAELVEAARVAEAHGVDTFWLGDEGAGREPFATLVAAANATTRIGLGVAATNPYLRHPALTAAATATVAEISGRCVHLAFARGGRAALGPLGVRPSRPIEALDQAMRAARELLAGRPEVDLWLAGRGPRVAELASRIADGFFLNVTKPSIAPIARRARTHQAVQLSLMLPLALTEEQRELMRPYVALSLLDAPRGTPELTGLTTQAAEDAAHAIGHGDTASAAANITDGVLSNIAVVGTEHEAARELAELTRAHRIDEIGAAVWSADLQPAVEASASVLTAAARRAGQ